VPSGRFPLWIALRILLVAPFANASIVIRGDVRRHGSPPPRPERCQESQMVPIVHKTPSKPTVTWELSIREPVMSDGGPLKAE
jgi:hypothetical protein